MMKNKRTLAVLAATLAIPAMLWAAIINRDVAPNAAIDTSKLADGTKLAGAIYFPGTKAVDILRVAANVVEGQTVTIGASVFEVDVVNTDSTVDVTGGDLNNTTDPVQVTFAAHAQVAGNLLRVENEIMKVLRVISASELVVARGRAGTTAATHADATDIFVSATPPAANIPVGLVTTLTPAVFTPALVDEIINAATAAGERSTSKASTIYTTHTATSLQTGAEMQLTAISVGATVTAVSETLAGANNVWAAAAMYGGAASGFKQVLKVKRTPNATEVALGTIRIPIGFTPTQADVYVVTTADGLAKAWDGARTLAAGLVTIDNAGSTDWAATDDVYVVAFE